jgi:hypothetical protein
MKLNGVRISFKASDYVQRFFLAKAKSSTAKLIPITNDSEIHLRSELNYIARLVVKNRRTHFTLVEKRNCTRFLIVQFSAARFPKDGTRLSQIQFLCNSGLPSKLTSLPLSEFRYGIEFPKKSIKNTVFGDDQGNWHLYVRKTGSDSAEIQTKVAVDPLWLFAIGIAVFLGKPPKR